MRLRSMVYVVFASMLVILIFLLIFFILDTEKSKTHIPEGLFVGGLIPVGGLSYSDAYNKVREIVQATHTETRTITTDIDSTWKKAVTLSDLGPFILEKDFQNAVHKWNTEKDVVYRFFRWITFLLNTKSTPRDLSVPISWSGDVDSALKKVLDDFEKKIAVPHITTKTSLQNSLEDSLFTTYPTFLLVATERNLNLATLHIPEKIYIRHVFNKIDDERDTYHSVLSYDQVYALLLPGEITTASEKKEWFINMHLLRKITQTTNVRNATFDVRTPESVVVVPSRAGIVLDYLGMSQKLLRALNEQLSFIVPEYTSFIEPTFTTKMAEQMQIKHLVASFTTYYSAGAARADNIQRIAQLVDGALIPAGEQFNLNEYVGKRTAARGFKKAGMIFMGELVDDYGGGVSQFATTLYNASFWGGYKDVYHKAHSWYFSRYPEGIEATVSWGEVDLIFENDYASGLLIKTHYTNTSITVELYGNNNGRSVVGKHRYGKTNIDISNAGGDLARTVTGSISQRYDIREPGVKFILDQSKTPFSSPSEHSGTNGWTVTVYRTVTKPYYSEDNNLVIEKEESSWPVHYLPEAHVIYVHECTTPAMDHNTPIMQLKNCAPPVVR